jgi:ribose-phosphate pyrophosphokinase
MTDDKHFLTPEEHNLQHESPRGELLLASCRSGAYLASHVAERYNERLSNDDGADRVSYLASIDYQFSDTETCVRLEEDVSGRDVFLFQGLYNPLVSRSVDEHYMALLTAIRAFREWGAHKITAIAPYLSYARQDKPTRNQREPTTARLMADLSIKAGLDRIVTWHPHTSQIRGFYGRIPVDMLDALVLFKKVFHKFKGRDDVIVVAPDAGISKFVVQFSRMMNLDYAIAFKYRPRQEDALVSEIIGEFEDKRVALVLDDMISSGGTMTSLIETLLNDQPTIEAIHIGASHNLCNKKALGRMKKLHTDYRLKELIVTDSIPQTQDFLDLPFLRIESLADTLVHVINSIHYNRSLGRSSY